MPELPPPKRLASVRRGPEVPAETVRYAELHCRTNYSFLEGASHPDELAARAAQLGYTALAITDQSSLAGVVRAHVAAREAGLKLLIGAEITPIDAPPVLLWAMNRAGYARLARLLTLGRRAAPKGECHLAFHDLADHAEGLLVGVLLPAAVVRALARSPASGLKPAPRLQTAVDDLRRYKSVFVDRCYGVAELCRGPNDRRALQQMMQAAREAHVPIVAGNDVHYHVRERRPLQDVLTAIRHGCTVAELGDRLFPNAERHLKSPAEMAELFAECPEAITNTVELAERCTFSLDELRYEYPEELCPPGQTPIEHLTRLTWEGARQRYSDDSCVSFRKDAHMSSPSPPGTPGGEGRGEGGLSPGKNRKLLQGRTPSPPTPLPLSTGGEGRRGENCQTKIAFDESVHGESIRGEPRPVRARSSARRKSTGPLRGSARLPEKVRILIEHELKLIAELRYEAYFLTVWDLVQFARGRGILCQGRGSAANSAVCFCLGITSVDPERIDVLFERFVSKERDEAPDIDVDFEHERREEVLQYIYDKYGRERAGMTAEVITYQVRSAVRDAGKALGLSPDRVDVLAKAMDHHSHDQDKLSGRLAEAGFPAESSTGRHLIELVRQLLDFPRHLSQHVGGMIITRGPLCELVPIENAAMAERTVVQWDKNDLDALGILKVDCLSLGMLTAIRKCFDLVEKDEGRRMKDETFSSVPGSAWDRTAREAPPLVPTGESRERRTSGRRSLPGRAVPGRAWDREERHPSSFILHPFPKLTLATIPPEDPKVYDMICRADTIGVFQIESRAQMSMLPRLRPKCFYDLVIEVAIVRPGPIQGDMVHPYLRRRAGQEPVDYPDERIKAVLEKTLGVPIFQEQAMRLAVVAAGFTPGEADQLRRAMGAWRRRGVMEKFQKKLIDGMLGNGYSADFAGRVFRQIQGFGEYGFPESHAASFALLVYVSAWLKYHHPAAFACALLNSQPMGFYAPAQLVADARKHGVEVLPVDVNHSQWDCTLEFTVSRDRTLNGKPENATGLRLGFRLVHGLSAAQVAPILAAERPFTSYQDFIRRTGLRGATVKRLAQADAFRSLGMGRRAALWQSLPQGEPLPLFEIMEMEEEMPATLPTMAPLQEVLADYSSAGLTLRQHPIAFIRPELDRLGVEPASRLTAGGVADRKLKVAGVVLLRQRPSTAKGITFVTLEDETGMVNLIVRQNVWERYRRVARQASVMLAHGRLQREAGVIHVLVTKLEDLSPTLARLNTSSRDFR